jgi:hypothetical protein
MLLRHITRLVLEHLHRWVFEAVHKAHVLLMNDLLTGFELTDREPASLTCVSGNGSLCTAVSAHQTGAAAMSTTQ